MGGNCAHDVCTTGAALNPACDPCVTFVCAFDNLCCSSGWDSICVSWAESFCGVMCP
jgi:hypothetical protein